MIFYSTDSEGFRGFSALALHLIETHRLRSCLDLGGGANPLLSLPEIEEHNLTYTLSDIEPYELGKADRGYRKLVWDACETNLSLSDTFDFVFSKTVAEHVPQPEIYYQNIFSILRPGGITAHFFPTLYAPPFVCNLLLPDRLSSAIVNLLQKGRHEDGHHRKFRAYYRWCRGPTPGNIRRLESTGFKILEYRGYFGFRGYLQRVPSLLPLHDGMVRWLLRHPIPQMTSFATVVMQKPL